MNLEELLQPLSDDAPAGEECYYKPKFRELTPLCEFLIARAELEELRRRERLVYQGSNAASDRQFAATALSTAEERFKQITAQAKDLLQGRNPAPGLVADEIEARCAELLITVGKDLAVVRRWALAALQLRGVAGFGQAVELFERLSEAFGDAAYPAPEGAAKDLSARASLLGELVNGNGFLALLRETTVVASAPGRMSFRDAEVQDAVIEADTAGGGLSGPVHLKAIVQVDAARVLQIDPKLIDGAALKQHLGVLRQPITAAQDRLQRLVAGYKSGLITNDRVIVLLRRAAHQLGTLEDELGADAASAAVNAAVGLDAGAGQRASANGALAAVLGGRRLATRDDARGMILEIAVFLERSEPGHPSPMFLRRAERLLGAATFFDIVRDMAPDAISEVERITGQSAPEPASRP